MATKRKVRRFDEGGMTDEEVASFAGIPENDSNAGMAEATKEPETKTRGLSVSSKSEEPSVAKAPIVSKKQLQDFQEKHGADKTLRDYMNAQKGLTRRGEKSEPRVNGRTFAEDVAERKKNAVATSMSRNENYGNESRRPVNKPTGRGVINTSNLDKNTLLPKMANGGSVSSASRRADGIASKGKTKGRMV